MADHATVKKSVEYFKMTILMVFLVLLAGAHAEDLSGTADAPSASTAPPPERVLQPTRESIYRHLAAELQHALGAEEHIKSVFAGLAAGIDDSVTVTVVPSLQVLIDSVVERAEDAWVAADDAGRTVDVKVCVDGAENDAQQVAKRALEKMRGCLEALEQEGKRRTREAARLLVEIEGISKRFVSELETCVKDEETKDATQPAADDMIPLVDVDATVPTNTADTSVTDTPADETVPESEVAERTSSCAKSSAEKVAGSGQATCSKCKKTVVASEEDLAASQEEVLIQESLEPKRKCKGEKCEKLKKKTDVKTPENVSEGEVKKQKDEKKKDGHQKQKKGYAVVDEESLEGGGDGEAGVESDTGSLEKLQKQGKHGKKTQKHEKGLKNKEKSKKGEKYESSNIEETGAEASGNGYMDGKDKKKNKKQKVKSQEIQSTENDNAGEESIEYKEQKSAEGKYKKEKKFGKKDEGKTKGKKDETQDESSEGKGRRKRDLLPFQENVDIDLTENDHSQQISSEQPVDNTASNSDASTAPKWPTEGSSPEEQYVITCMGSTVMKPLIDEKNRAFQKLQRMLKRVRDKEQEAPAQCVTDHVRKAEMKITAIKTRMASCAERKMRQDL